MVLEIDLHRLKQSELEILLGVTGRTLQRWHTLGLPKHGQGPGCYYVWAEILPWFVAFATKPDSGLRLKAQDAPYQKANWFKALEHIDAARLAMVGEVGADARPRRIKPKAKPPRPQASKPRQMKAIQGVIG